MVKFGNSGGKRPVRPGTRPVLPPFSIIPVPIFWALFIDALDILKAPITTFAQFFGIGIAANVVVAFLQGILATYVFADPIMLFAILEGGIPSPLDIYPTVTTILLLEMAAGSRGKIKGGPIGMLARGG